MEWHLASEQHVQDDAEGPDICRSTYMILLHGHLGAHVYRRAARVWQARLVRRLDPGGEPEVDKLGLVR